MTEEIMNAAILRLQARALEHYGIIKNLYKETPKEGTVDEIVKNAISLVQFEGAMVTLQQYRAQITAEIEAAEADVNEESETSEAEPSTEIGEEDLKKRSPSFRNSQKGKKKK